MYYLRPQKSSQFIISAVSMNGKLIFDPIYKENKLDSFYVDLESIKKHLPGLFTESSTVYFELYVGNEIKDAVYLGSFFNLLTTLSAIKLGRASISSPAITVDFQEGPSNTFSVNVESIKKPYPYIHFHRGAKLQVLNASDKGKNVGMYVISRFTKQGKSFEFVKEKIYNDEPVFDTQFPSIEGNNLLTEIPECEVDISIESISKRQSFITTGLRIYSNRDIELFNYNKLLPEDVLTSRARNGIVTLYINKALSRNKDIKNYILNVDDYTDFCGAYRIIAGNAGKIYLEKLVSKPFRTVYALKNGTYSTYVTTATDHCPILDSSGRAIAHLLTSGGVSLGTSQFKDTNYVSLQGYTDGVIKTISGQKKAATGKAWLFISADYNVSTDERAKEFVEMLAVSIGNAAPATNSSHSHTPYTPPVVAKKELKRKTTTIHV